MIPQDARSPFRQVRWVEIYNSGSVEIPAFGATEIIGETEPESGSELTPDAGRTVLQVQRPTCDSSPNVCFNGQHPVGVGKYGRGTIDPPCWALCESTTNGDKVGTVDDSFELGLGKSGYIVIGGSYEGATRIREPVRQFGIYRATLLENMCVGDAEADVNSVELVGPCCDTDVISGTITAKNFSQAGCTGDDVLMIRSCSSGVDKWLIFQVEHKEVTPLISAPYYDACALKFPKQAIAVQHCCAAAGTDTITMYEHTYVADAQLVKAGTIDGTGGTGQQTCNIKLQLSYETFCAFTSYTPASMADKSTMTFSPLHIVVDVVDDGTCLEKIRQWVYLLCWDDDDAPVDIICTEECPP